MHRIPTFAPIFSLLLALPTGLACDADGSGEPPDGGGSSVDASSDDGGAPDATGSGDDASGGDGAGACSSDEACRVVLDGEAGPCERAACVEGGCEWAPANEGASCTPDDACLVDGSCVDGVCESDTERDCDDGNPCTVDGCDPEQGCTSEPVEDGTACDDGDPCTVEDRCVAGSCEGEPKDCDDGNPCTEGDHCDPETGECVPGEVPPCDDGNACTTNDACNPETGLCEGEPTSDCECDEDADCSELDDGNPCNGVLVCEEQQCVTKPGSAVSCDGATGSPCTTSTCDPTTGECVAEAVEDGTACDDGAPCTSGDACVDGICEGEQTTSCDDGNPCTQDSCTGEGCSYDFDPECGCDGEGCTPTGEFGDPLQMEESLGLPAETVGLKMVAGHPITCGGFGLNVFATTEDDTAMQHADTALSRCQSIEAGPMRPDGKRIVYASHHGDAYVTTPAVHVLALEPGVGSIDQVDQVTMPDISAEGMAYVDGTLWLAMHEAGLRRYDVADDGTLTEEATLEGVDNAWHVEARGKHLHVADGGGGFKVLDAEAGEVVGEVELDGFAKDVTLTGPMALVAASSKGVTAIDVSEPTAPEVIETVFTHGSALEVELMADGTRLAVANVEDVVVLDVSHPDALKVLGVDAGTAKDVVPKNLAVAAEGTTVISGEWRGIGLLSWHDDLVSPEFHVNRSSLQFGNVGAGEEATRELAVLNRGWKPLEVSEIVPDDPAAWSVEPTSFELDPQGSQKVTVTFAPSSEAQALEAVTFHTNDPDEPEVSLATLANVGSGSKLTVGDELTSEFDFLDREHPPGERDVDNLEGHVLVLAYFATF